MTSIRPGPMFRGAGPPGWAAHPATRRGSRVDEENFMRRIRSILAAASVLALGLLGTLPIRAHGAPGRPATASPARAAPPAHAALDSLPIAPYEIIVDPAHPCAHDSVALVLHYCGSCSHLLGTERSSKGLFKVFLSTPVDSDTTAFACPRVCPYPTVRAEMGGYSPGTHQVIVQTINRVVLPDSTYFEVPSIRIVEFVVRDSCATPPPPPPGGLPYVRTIEIGAQRPCAFDGQICPYDSITVRVAGTFPSDCFIVRRIDLIPSPSATPIPQPPTVRILIDDLGCIARQCVGGQFLWSASFKIGGLAPRDYHLPFQLAKVSCSDSFPHDSTVHFASVPFTVAQHCTSGTIASRCVLPIWEHPGGETLCDDRVSRDHPAHLVLELRSTDALSGLQGRLLLYGLRDLVRSNAVPDTSLPIRGTGLTITAIEPIGPAEQMHLQWSPVEGGARFVMFADAGAPIPALPPGPDSLPGVPVLRVTVSQPDSGLVAPIHGLTAVELLGADASGAGVTECDLPCLPRRPFAIICTERHDCDVNHDGSEDVRDLVTMVHCVLHTGGCPDSSAAAFDCNGDAQSSLDDVLCCAGVILTGHLPDSTARRAEPGITAEFGDPVRTADGVDVPLAITGDDRIGAARLSLSYPADRFDVSGVSLEGIDRNWLELHQRDADRLLIGLIRIAVATPALGIASDGRVHAVIHFKLKPGAAPTGMVTLTAGDFSGSDGAALEVNLGQPAQALGEGPIGLSAVQPNPFGRETRFAVKLARPARVELEVHDLVGRRVATIHRGALPAGTRVFSWNGRDANGSRAANGVYFVRLVTDGRVTARKVVLVREP